MALVNIIIVIILIIRIIEKGDNVSYIFIAQYNSPVLTTQYTLSIFTDLGAPKL